MSRLFLTHSSADNAAAIALGQWLAEHGYTDVFLDIDPDRGLAPGERWIEALKTAADRCEAVLCLVSPDWLASSWCLAEFYLARSLHKRIFGLIVAPVPFEHLPPEMASEWQLCQLTGSDRVREFSVAGRTVAFSGASLDRLRRGLERAGLDARGFSWPPQSEPNRAPYRGLRALEPQDSAIFFGRDALVVRGMDQIRGMAELGLEKLLVVLGASGAGKSSFLLAGLWPRLARDDAQFLPLPVIRPLNAVITGSTGLAAALSAAFARVGEARAPGSVKASLAASGAGAFGHMLDEITERARARLVQADPDAPTPTVVLLLDQAEELLSSDGAVEIDAFLPMLAAVLASGRRVLAIATIRTDRYQRLQDAALLPGVKRALFDLPPMPVAEFKSVIEGPARCATEAGRRLEVSPALTEALVADATGADALPLLAFTLERLWLDYGVSGRLTLADYAAMGGVQGSIEAAVTAALADPERPPAIPADQAVQHRLLRAAFIPWLARVDPATGQRMRRSARIEDMPASARAIVDRFVAARLLVADRRGGADVIEVAHESLLRQWPTLMAWLDADEADLKSAEEIEHAAAEWERNGRRTDWLDHRADRLDAAERLLQRDDFRARLGHVGTGYIVACRSLIERERGARETALARQARTQRRVWWALTAFATAVLVGGVTTFWFYRRNLARQAALDRAGVYLLAEIAGTEMERGNLDRALRLSVHATRRALAFPGGSAALSPSLARLTASLLQSNWRLVLKGPESPMWFAAYSPNGAHIVTASDDKTARIWDAASGQQVAVLRGHENRVRFAVYNSDGARIVTASFDKTARVWDAASGQQVAVLRGHEDVVWSAAYSPDGARIVTASDDKTARVWDAASGQQVAVLWGHEKLVLSATYSPDGARIVTTSDDNTARVWDAASGQQVAILRGHENWVRSAAYSPDHTRIVTASDDKTARVWDVVSEQQVAVLRGHEGPIWSAAYSPDGGRIVTASDDKTVRIWDATSGQQVAVLRGHEDVVWSAAYSPDGARILTASYDKTARVWDAASGPQVAVLRDHENRVRFAAYSPDGARIVTASLDNVAQVWDAASGQQVAVLRGHENGLRSAVYSLDGARIVTASFDNTARVWDATSGQQVAVLRGHENGLRSAAYSPDGAHIVTASDDRTARVWDAASGEQIAVLRGHENRVRSAAYNPDGARIVTASDDKTARVWDAASGEQIAVLLGHEIEVLSAAYSPDGARIVTASFDNTARIWDAVSRQQVAVLHGHENRVWSAAYSLDGARIVTASDDNTARVWDATSGQQVAVLRGHENGLRSAAYSPDGARIVTASDDNTARIWDVRVASMSRPQLLVDACRRCLPGLSKLTRAEMDLIGSPADAPEIDVCGGLRME